MTPIDKIMQRIQARIGHRVQDRMSGEGATPWGEAWGLLTDPAEAIGKSSEPLDTFNDPNEASEGDAEMGAAKPAPADSGAPADADAATPGGVPFQSMADMDREEMDDYYADVAGRAMGGA
tara:strand:+ start:647 stop:1009 length:363 start_codon:yes stop_codon:yes gene_type:complete